VAANSRKIVATELLGTHRSQWYRIDAHSRIHPG